jgi:toxin-antitoxin system PIN domain toxin
VIGLDANVLVYAHRTEYGLHAVANELIRHLAEGPSQWAIPWPCVHEFYAVVTNPRIHERPTSPEEAWTQIDAWRASPSLTLLGEAHNHADRLRELTVSAHVTAGQVHDARVAAICLDHGVTELVTMDRDFSRFPQLRTRSLLV